MFCGSGQKERKRLKSTVALVPCGSYEPEKVYQALREGLELIGGIGKYIRKDEKVLLKLNLVREADADRAVTTHPAVAEMLARILSEEDYSDVSAGDSGGFGSSIKSMERLGMREELKKYGCRMAAFDEAVRTEYPEGIHAKEFMLARDVIEADAIVSVCKMKTHALEHITGAVKNQYGCVQGKHKAAGHTRYPSAESMARMIVDLNLLVRPRLYVMDGIVAMEGNGPTSGDPVPMKILLFSTDPVALDSVFARLVYLDPEAVPTEVAGAQMGLGTWKEEEIVLLTPDGAVSMEEAVQKYGRPDFRVIRKKGKAEGIMNTVTILRFLKPGPRIDADKCRKCGVCVESCPVEGKALTFSKGRNHPPVYNYRKCIRCFCCQEMCPHKAIYVRGRR
jgi:uncharacterized protein (DUF362 family)/NAD-dependent dihydropyrimidine dehydrogenase PreA subunit